MVFDMRIDTTIFKLQLSDFDAKLVPGQKSTVSIEYQTPEDGISKDIGSDALIHLNNFNGTLSISRKAVVSKSKAAVSKDVVSSSVLASTAEEKFDEEHSQLKEQLKSPTNSSNKSRERFLDESLAPETSKMYKNMVTSSPNITSLTARKKEVTSKPVNRRRSEANVTNPSVAMRGNQMGFGATKLHTELKNDKIDIEALKEMLKQSPGLVSARDKEGKLPLHVLANNESLVCGPDKVEIRSFVIFLLKLYPAAVHRVDSKGHIPFAAPISEWVQQSNSVSKDLTTSDRFLKEFAIWKGDRTIPSSEVPVTQIVKWSFEMLSFVVEYFEKSKDHRKMAVEMVMRRVSAIPSLLKTILLIDDYSYKFQLLEMPICQRMLLMTKTVDNWLVAMLASGGEEASKAIDYFEALSSVNIYSALGLQHRARLTDQRIFKDMQQKMVLHLAGINGIIPSLFLLGSKEVHRASSKVFVQRILQKRMMEPTLIGLIILDLCFNVVLLIAYPLKVKLIVGNIIDRGTWSYVQSVGLILLICAYFLVRDNITTLIVARSYRFFLKKALVFTELVKNLSIILTITTSVLSYLDIRIANMYSITVGFLWLRFFISYIEVNSKLAVFVLSVGRIIRGMSVFLFLIFVSTTAFTEMVRMVYVVHHDQLCVGVDPTTETTFDADFCSANFFRAFSRGYALIAGDMTLSGYRKITINTVFYILFTLVGVIVLLNILIAIILDIYQKSVSQRQTLLGKERLGLLAKHVSLVTFFRRLIGEHAPHRKLNRILLGTFGILVLVAFQLAFFGYIMNIIQLREYLYFNYLIIASLLLFWGFINTTLFYLFGHINKVKAFQPSLGDKKEKILPLRVARNFLKAFAAKLLGIRKDFWIEHEETVFMPEHMKELIRESENRLLKKLIMLFDKSNSLGTEDLN